ncbi:MAG: DNA repair protein RadC [Chlamydiota bacterium]
MASEYSIQSLPVDERPRERLHKQGAEALSNSELLAIILGSGMRGKSVIQLSQELLSRFGGLEQLADATIEELCEVKGLGKAKAIQIRALVTLAGRLSQKTRAVKIKIEHPQSAYQLLRDQLENQKKEIFSVVMIDVKGYVINQQIISIGTLSNSLIHPREVFYPAIRHKASSILIAHNHPSGDPTPSKEDISVTKKLVEVGKLMGIPVRDHLIIGNDCYVSLRQEGVSF